MDDPLPPPVIPTVAATDREHPVAVLDTTELRWFADGTTPSPVRAWFTVDGTAGSVEEREDVYRLDGRHDLGVKWRHGTTLEVKLRRSTGRELVLDGNLRGRPEAWRKWTPGDDRLDLAGGAARIVPVLKSVVKRVVVPSGAGLTGSLAACDVELAEVRVGDHAAWTIAFAASGSRRHHRQVIAAAWGTLVDLAPAPDAVRELVTCAGYPAWLATAAPPALAASR